MSKRTHMAVSVFDLLLCRCLALAAVGLDYQSEIDDARTLAMVADPRRDAMACATDGLSVKLRNAPFKHSHFDKTLTEQKEKPRSKRGNSRT